ncbi:uncharacterized protein BO66DRAFT_109830 [Aspergillus aculeatinus CBS 121060]|uniref:Uncharacterized protein n=1 Tax=Aspergillus aculeatinus CBS 121060 TaxID=1448322 RepID=A0ACD1HL11_9EURO|nr:hypothetical protein BO66DRAFT_109830 [Aspergillus aculeatinus CBS 121060]RAH74544.1 hypothetical protein BO66DRAFT_109830 [Aspergillus aculeatinus CBS 121060]
MSLQRSDRRMGINMGSKCIGGRRWRVMKHGEFKGKERKEERRRRERRRRSRPVERRPTRQSKAVQG